MVQVPADTAVTFPRESMVQTEAGPTVIEIGVDVFELAQILCGSSAVVIAVGGTNSGF